MKLLLPLALLCFNLQVFSQTITTRFELSGGKESPVYSEIIDWWKKLDETIW